MKRTLIVISLVGLAGCSSISTTTKTDGAACAAALVATLAAPASLPAIALATPACASLAKDVLDLAVKEAEKQLPAARLNASRMRR